MDAVAIQRVLDEIGLTAPQNIDRPDLADDIDIAVMHFKLAGEFGRRSPWKQRRDYEVRFSKAAHKLKALLHDEHAEWLFFEVGDAYYRRSNSEGYDPSASFGRLRDDIRRLTEAVEADLQKSERNGLSGGRKRDFLKSKYSPFTRLVGEFLAKVYQKHIGKTPSISRSRDGTPNGPYFRFVMIVLELEQITHNGKSYTAESIASAFRDAKS